MPRSKKSRKVGLIGVRSVPKEERKPIEKQDRKKKHTGKPSGNRQQEGVKTKPQGMGKAVPKDPRIGSKKPVSLTATKPAKTVPVKRFFSPAEELDAIENDKRLEKILALMEAGKAVAKDDERYAEEKLARHKIICQLMGISLEEDDNEEDDEQNADVYDRFERSNLDDYRQ